MSLIELSHNFDPQRFMWLWAKYVTGFNDEHHCTNAIRGRYSKRFSKNNPDFPNSRSLMFDEQLPGSYDAIYICGVAKQGYSNKQNYQRNVHAAILPLTDSLDEWSFEGWQMTVRGGRFLPIPAGPEEISERYRLLAEEFTSCRIFRWAASWYGVSE